MRRSFPLWLAAAFFAALTIAPAAAADVDASFALTEPGSFTIAGFPEPLAIPVEGTGFVGIIDDETGDFSGQFSIGTIPQLEVTFGAIAATVVVELVGGPATGTFDDETGEVDISTSLTFNIQVVTPLAINCSIANIVLEFSTSNPGGVPFDPELTIDEWAFVLTQQNFNIPVATGDALCSAVNDELGLPNAAGNAFVLSLESGVIPPPIPPVPPVIPETPGAEPARAVGAAPAFTG